MGIDIVRIFFKTYPVTLKFILENDYSNNTTNNNKY